MLHHKIYHLWTFHFQWKWCLTHFLPPFFNTLAPLSPVCGVFFDNFQRLRCSDLSIALLHEMATVAAAFCWCCRLMAGGFLPVALWFGRIFWVCLASSGWRCHNCLLLRLMILLFSRMHFLLGNIPICIPDDAHHASQPASQPAMNCILIRFMMVSRWGPRTNPLRSQPDLLPFGGDAKAKYSYWKKSNERDIQHSIKLNNCLLCPFHRTLATFFYPEIGRCCVNKSLKQKCLRAVH